MNRSSRIPPEAFDRLAEVVPLGRDAAAVRKRLVALERLLERSFVIPGLKVPVGLDFLFNLLPVGGSFIGAAMGSYMIWEARNLGMSKLQMARMAGNVGVDWAVGLIPVVGAVPDLLFRSNTRNLRIIKRHLDKHHPGTATIDNP